MTTFYTILTYYWDKAYNAAIQGFQTFYPKFMYISILHDNMCKSLTLSPVVSH